MLLKEELEKRGLLNQFTSEKIFDLYEKWGQNFYCGFDPTADSLTAWNMIPIMLAVNFMKRWNTFYMLVWWATWMIWDPGGKNAERNFLDEKTLKHNQECITKQMWKILENLKKVSGKDLKFKVINNYDFYKDMSILDFLRDVWKYITVNTMLTKETVKKRIEDPDKSISYTEFSYMLLQAYDHYKLYKDDNVLLQIAGWDQWWNLVTATEMIRKKLDKEWFWLTAPLILDASGKKFGKSEWNAILLDENKNSPYFAYQYFMNTADQDIERYLKFLTLLDFEKIDEIMKKHNEKPELRFGQAELAKYVITTIFSKESADQAEKISKIMFSNEDKMKLIKTLNDEDKKALFKEVGGVETCDLSRFKTWSEDLSHLKMLELLTKSWLTSSNGEAKKLIQAGWIFLNEKKVEDINYEVNEKDFVNGMVLLKKGKKNYKIVMK